MILIFPSAVLAYISRAMSAKVRVGACALSLSFSSPTITVKVQARLAS